MTGRRAALAVMILLAAAGGPAVALEAPTFNLESLSFQPGDPGGAVSLRFSGAPASFSCVVPDPGQPEIVIDLPGARTGLPDRVDLKNPLVPEASIEPQPAAKGAGLRLRLRLNQGVLAGFEQTGGNLLLRVTPSTAAAGVAGASDEYRVGIGDKIEINVFGHDDLTKIVQVRADGTINYPLIGDIQVAGKTVSGIDNEITRVLGKDYLVDPQVSVDVREYESQWVTIMGEVRTPGKYVLKRNMRLIDALAEAGGVTKDAGALISITRHDGDGSPHQLVIDRDRLFGQKNQEANVLLQHADIVAIGEKEVFYIRGEVTRPGPYLLESGMTLLKAISVGGGLTQFANRKQVDLLRSNDKGVVNMKVNLKAIEEGKQEDVPIQPNDTIIVPRRIF